MSSYFLTSPKTALDVDAALAELDPAYREVLEALAAGKKVSEYAREAGENESTLRSRLGRARVELERSLARS